MVWNSSTTSVLRQKYLDEDSSVNIDFKMLDVTTLDFLSHSGGNKVYVIPDWPCMAWYEALFTAENLDYVELPQEEDLFTDPNGNKLGKMAWKSYLFVLK